LQGVWCWVAALALCLQNRGQGTFRLVRARPAALGRHSAAPELRLDVSVEAIWAEGVSRL
jgi:hypothetical protein